MGLINREAGTVGFVREQGLKSMCLTFQVALMGRKEDGFVLVRSDKGISIVDVESNEIHPLAVCKGGYEKSMVCTFDSEKAILTLFVVEYKYSSLLTKI